MGPLCLLWGVRDTWTNLSHAATHRLQYTGSMHQKVEGKLIPYQERKVAKSKNHLSIGKTTFVWFCSTNSMVGYIGALSWKSRYCVCPRYLYKYRTLNGVGWNVLPCGERFLFLLGRSEYQSSSYLFCSSETITTVLLIRTVFFKFISWVLVYICALPKNTVIGLYLCCYF